MFELRVRNKSHDHVQLEGARTKHAQQYPPELCRAICRGLRDQLSLDHSGVQMVEHMKYEDLDANQAAVTKEIMSFEDEGVECVVPPEEEHVYVSDEWATDDVTGHQLDPKLVLKARQLEVEYIREMRLYDKVPIKMCWDRSGKKPIGGRWLDVNKGDSDKINMRSRYVAKDFNRGKGGIELFAATPPLEGLKWILAIAAQRSQYNEAG